MWRSSSACALNRKVGGVRRSVGRETNDIAIVKKAGPLDNHAIALGETADDFDLIAPAATDGDGLKRHARRLDRESTRLNSSHECASRMRSSAFINNLELISTLDIFTFYVL